MRKIGEHLGRRSGDAVVGACRAALALALVLAPGLVLAPAASFAATPSGTATLVPASVGAGAIVGAQPGASDSEIKSRLDQGDNLTVAGESLHVALLRRFYAAHDFQPVWPAHAAQAKVLWDAVGHAGDQGLDPDLFHAAALADPANLSLSDRDLLLSDAFLAYADALARGAAPSETRIADEALSPGPSDAVAALEAALAAPDPAAALTGLAPSLPAYAGLQHAFRTYQAIAAAGGWPRIDDPRPDARFRQVQQRLAAENYLPEGYQTGQYDPATVDAVKSFQERHGIEADGKLGPATLAELNIPADARVRQIAVNLERWRWLPRPLPAERVWVNTAAMRIRYFRDDQQVFAGRVIVGEIDKQTPEFATTIKSLLYNPPWNVPVSIAEKEILPKLETEPDYLEKHNMVMRDSGGITQLPGAGTALGRLKFEMEDRFDVYLHDTPLRYLFVRDNRHLSHGCVRVQNPRDLAALLIQEPVETINKGIAPGYTNRRMLAAPVPVFIVYQTAFVDGDGTLEFRRDAYRRDDDIARRLTRTPQVPIAARESQRRG